VYTTGNYVLSVSWATYISLETCFNNQFNAQFLYSITICMLPYNPQRDSNINMPISRRTNCIITAFGIVTLCKRLYSMPDESIYTYIHIVIG
jgi:hypothetical protein